MLPHEVLEEITYIVASTTRCKFIDYCIGAEECACFKNAKKIYDMTYDCLKEDDESEFIKLGPINRWRWLAENKPIDFVCSIGLFVALYFISFPIIYLSNVFFK